jgi:alkanesulfonate monooxygenase SsuD/methylene tetrahydromethanopterin reductase-like flavin-dependent oxidoreductase (luciferase family)
MTPRLSSRLSSRLPESPPVLPGIGFQVWGQHATWPDLAATAGRIEALGFASLWTNDHFFPAAGEAAATPDAPPGPFLEGWVTLAAFAALTTRIPLGILVSAAGYRSIGVTVKQATAVDHVSGGRMTLGLGAGWHPRDHAAFGFELLPIGQRLDRLEAQVAAARALLGGETVTAGGPYVVLDRAVNLPGPVQAAMPILIGGSGERRTLRIVARFADAWNGEGDVETWARRNRILDEHCTAIGRDPSTIRRTVGLPPASIRSTREAAVTALAERLEANGLAPDEARSAAAASPLVGTPARVAEALAAYGAAGAAEVIVDWPAPFDDRTLDALAAVAPGLG